MQVLAQAASAAHEAVLNNVTQAQRYSRFPVHSPEFWTAVFAMASNPQTAQKVLDELAQIEDEPCIENERVWANVRHAKSRATLAVLN